MDNDTATAATMQALNEERLKLRCDVEALQALLAERREYAERLLAENVRLTNEAGELRAALDAARQALNENDLELARAMSRADVLAAEVRKWRDVNEKAQAVRKLLKQHGSGGALVEQLKRDAEASLRVCIEETMVNTDRTHALDPEKFEVKP